MFLNKKQNTIFNKQLSVLILEDDNQNYVERNRNKPNRCKFIVNSYLLLKISAITGIQIFFFISQDYAI